MLRGRICLLVVTLAALGARRAAAEEPDLSAPAVCAPPCPDGEICVGTTCVVPNARPAAAARPRPTTPPPPQAPAGSASTTGPQPAGTPRPGNAPPTNAPLPGNTHPPAPAPPPRVPPPAYAPPPGYPPPATYYPPPQPLSWNHPPPPTPPRPPRLKRIFLALPYFGVHTYQNRQASVYGPGLRFGSLIGGRLNDRLSLNAELTIDVSNVDGPVSNAVLGAAVVREYSVAVGFAPLLQVPARWLEIVVGPKAGIFVLDTEIAAMGVGIGSSQRGVVFGIDAGVFVPASPTTSLGVLLAFEFRKANDTCQAFSQGAFCGLGAASGLASIVGMTVAVLF